MNETTDKIKVVITVEIEDEDYANFLDGWTNDYRDGLSEHAKVTSAHVTMPQRQAITQELD